MWTCGGFRVQDLALKLTGLSQKVGPSMALWVNIEMRLYIHIYIYTHIYTHFLAY